MQKTSDHASGGVNAERWVEALIANRFPMHSVILRISTEKPNKPIFTRYLIGSMSAGHMPFGIDHPESLEAAMDEAAAKFGIGKEDWVELPEPPIFAVAFDSAMDEAIERASDALGLSNEGDEIIDPTG